jgi:hypothetical protein
VAGTADVRIYVEEPELDRRRIYNGTVHNTPNSEPFEIDIVCTIDALIYVVINGAQREPIPAMSLRQRN